MCCSGAASGLLGNVSDLDIYPPNARGRTRAAFDLVYEAIAKAVVGGG
jgi:hypothetical protein